MGQSYQDGKYALSVSLFVSFYGDLESKLSIGGPKKSTPLTSTLRRVTAWLCFMASGLNLTQLTINNLWKGKETI